MQRTPNRYTFLCLALFASLPWACPAIATRLRLPDASQSVAKSVNSQRLAPQNVSPPLQKIIVVEIPVVVAIGFPAQAHNLSNSSAPAGGDTLAMHTVSTCEKASMQLWDPWRMEQEKQCEQKGNFTEEAVRRLQSADVNGSMALAEQAFVKCANFTSFCAKEASLGAMLKMRLAGLAITEKCVAMAKTARGNATADEKACSQNATSSVMTSLANKSVEGALASAQHGLQMCFNLPAPCDFQLAPLLMQEVVAAQEQLWAERNIIPALMAGITAAKKRGALARATGGNATAPVNSSNTTALPGGRLHGISLVSVATTTRIATKKATLRRV